MTWQALSEPISLKQGGQYYASIHLSWAEKLVATPAMVCSKFAAVGFTGVTCQLEGSEGNVEGQWPLPDQDGVTLPVEVTGVSIWVP